MHNNITNNNNTTEHSKCNSNESKSVFELHGSQSMPGPLTCYDGLHTMRKISGTEGAAVGPLNFCAPCIKHQTLNSQVFLKRSLRNTWQCAVSHVFNVSGNNVKFICPVTDTRPMPVDRRTVIRRITFLEQLNELHGQHVVLSRIYQQFGKKELHCVYCLCECFHVYCPFVQHPLYIVCSLWWFFLSLFLVLSLVYEIKFYTCTNGNSHDDVYGAVIVAVHCHCESSPGSSDECSTQRQVAADLWTKPIRVSQ